VSADALLAAAVARVCIAEREVHAAEAALAARRGDANRRWTELLRLREALGEERDLCAAATLRQDPAWLGRIALAYARETGAVPSRMNLVAAIQAVIGALSGGAAGAGTLSADQRAQALLAAHAAIQADAVPPPGRPPAAPAAGADG
jgi:predicted secreted protein